MNQPHPGMPPFGSGYPPVAPPPAPPGPQQPNRPGTGRTLLWLALGLVFVLLVILVVFLLVRDEDEKADEDTSSGASSSDARETSCQAYAEVALSSETWAATQVDPDKVQQLYDAALADITDDEVETLVSQEATLHVAYYRALGEWKQSLLDEVAQGGNPETTIPAELTAQKTEALEAQRAVLEVCKDSLDDGGGGGEPLPSITAPPLETPSLLEETQ